MIDKSHTGDEFTREQPFELRYYPSVPLLELASPLTHAYRCQRKYPPQNVAAIAALKDSIAQSGMRNPLIVEYYNPWNDRESAEEKFWGIRVGNQRASALLELGEVNAPALVIVPLKSVSDPAPLVTPPWSGGYRVVRFMDALTLFDASHPWWHSYILRKFRPELVPPAA